MKILIADADAATREVFTQTLSGHELVFQDGPLTHELLATHPDTDVLSVFISSAVKQSEIDMLPQLRCIVTRSTGCDHIDIPYAQGKGITVSNVPKYGAHTVAEFTFALMLAVSRRIFDAVYQVREDGNFKTESLEGFDLFGKTLGVIGTGAIGRNVVAIARGFGMQVLMFDKFPNTALENDGARYVSFDELLAQADVVTLHVPMLPENYHLIGAEQIAKMKRGVTIINTARGDLVDAEALIDGLESGQVTWAGLDVLEEERMLRDEIALVRGEKPINELKAVIRDHALLRHPRVLFTPHVAFFSKEAYREILSVSAQDAAAYLSGVPQNIVNA